MIGALAVAALIVVGIRLQVEARDSSAANALAREKVEELKNYPVSSPQRVRGGALDSNVVNYNDSPDGRFRRRWLIETSPTDAGVPSSTQRVTVVVIADRPDVRLRPFQISTLFRQ